MASKAQQLHDSSSSVTCKAERQCMEPYLAVELSVPTNGHIDVKLSATPDHCTETHEYEDDIAQSYLPGIINSCQAVLASGSPAAPLDSHVRLLAEGLQ